MNSPKLTLVGAGPGSVDLITLRGMNALKHADVVLYDALVNPELLLFANSNAHKIYVGKRKGEHHLSQDEINNLIVDSALTYGHVVRIKGGDPFIFGRGYEELLHANKFNIPAEYIPGVSSSSGVPGLHGIPVTHRGVSESFWVITATNSSQKIPDDLRSAVKTNATVVVLMGLSKLDDIVSLYLSHNKPHVSVAVIQNGSSPQSQTALGTIRSIKEMVEQKGITSPAVIVIGDVARLHPEFPNALCNQDSLFASFN